MTLIADATALILLSKVGMLEKLTNRNKVVIPERVYEEVVKGKEKGRLDSLIVEKLVQEKKIIIKACKVADRIEKTFRLRGGELEVISLAYPKETVLSDDKKCLNVAKALGMDFITSPDVVVALQKNGTITREDARDCIDGLEEYGWYSRELIKKYLEELK